MIFPIYPSKQKFQGLMDLLLLIDDDNSHYVYIKDFNRFTFHKTKDNNKKLIYKKYLHCFTSENIIIKHIEDCLSINGVQLTGVEQGITEFQNYLKQLAVPSKIYANFECNLENTEIYEGSYTKKYHDHALCSFAYKVICIDDKFSKPIVAYRGENPAYKFIKEILKEYKYCQKNKEQIF